MRPREADGVTQADGPGEYARKGQLRWTGQGLDSPVATGGEEAGGEGDPKCLLWRVSDKNCCG